MQIKKNKLDEASQPSNPENAALSGLYTRSVV